MAEWVAEWFQLRYSASIQNYFEWRSYKCTFPPGALANISPVNGHFVRAPGTRLPLHRGSTGAKTPQSTQGGISAGGSDAAKAAQSTQGGISAWRLRRRPNASIFSCQRSLRGIKPRSPWGDGAFYGT